MLLSLAGSLQLLQIKRAFYVLHVYLYESTFICYQLFDLIRVGIYVHCGWIPPICNMAILCVSFDMSLCSAINY